MKRLTTEEFIIKSKEVHKNKYDYSKSSYSGNKIDITIICPEHGEFVQKPYRHMLGDGCSKCSGVCKMNTKEVVVNFTKVHGNKYDYSLVNYKNNKTKVKINCKEHGIFKQSPNNHLVGKGCPICGTINQANKQRIIPIELIKLSKSTRGLVTKSYNRKGFTKRSRTSKILGCTWSEFKEHLENNPYGFKVDQEGLDLDHIVPISSAETEEDIIKLNHYTNFQLLPSDYNRWIKACKLFNRDHFEEWLLENKLIKEYDIK